jgi:LPS sulfotransferase NodH
MVNASSYIICATPRSGSTLLCDLLSETGVAGRPNSYYRGQDILSWAREWDVSPNSPEFDRSYLDAVRRVGTGETGVFGFRLMWGSVAELSMRLGTLHPGLPDDVARFEKAFGQILYIHLARQDKIAQAVSLLRAEQTGLWHLSADGTKRERTSPPQLPVYDADRLAGFVKELEMHDAGWSAWFARHQLKPLQLTYETIAVTPQLVLADILSALGRDPQIAATVVARTAKMADEISLKWAERFRSGG